MSVRTEIDRIIGAVEAAHLKVVEKGGTTNRPYLVGNLEEAIESIPDREDLTELLDEQDQKIAELEELLENKAEATPTIESLEINQNGTYTAPNGVDGYSPITVNVPIPSGYIKPAGTKSITENGTHDVTQYASATVNVPSEDLSAEIAAQKQLIADIQTALQGKAAGGGGGLPENLSALDCGIYTANSTVTTTVNVPHKMGVVPDFCVWILIKSCETVPAASTNVTGCLIVKPSILSTSSSAAIYDAFQAITGYNASKSLARTASAVQTNPMTDQYCCIIGTSAYRLQAGDSYFWITGKFKTA